MNWISFVLPALIRLARPHQYIKNGFVLVGPVFGRVNLLLMWPSVLLAVLSFCAMASAVYVLNDIFDAEVDRIHPIKCRRPIASGEVPVRIAWVFAAFLALTGVVFAVMIGPIALLVIITYALMQYGYSVYWKHVVIVDVFLIALGFMLRIFMGTLGLGIPPSNWLMLCGLSITLFLGFAKRHSEIMIAEKSDTSGKLSTRKVLDDYSPAMIEQFIAICAACTILTYSLYTVSAQTVAFHNTAYLVCTVPLVIYGIFRYLYLLHCEQYGGDTSRELFKDRHLLATALGWGLFVLAIIGLQP